MDMKGLSERRFVVHLNNLGKYRFSSQASEDGQPHGNAFVSDEPDPVGDASGPATPALLGAAVAHCLSASLLEALRHAHLEVLDLQAEAVAVVKPNAEGNPRIDHIEVSIQPHLKKSSPRMHRCAEIFENYCTVTSSVKRGIDVRVSVDWQIAEAEGEDMRPDAMQSEVKQPSTNP